MASLLNLPCVKSCSGKTKRQRGLAWIGALAVFGYIIAVARSRDPWLGLLAGSF